MTETILLASSPTAVNSLLSPLTSTFNSCGDFLLPSLDSEWLSCYEKDSQTLCKMPPLAVFRPNSLDCLPAFIHACTQLEIPIAPRCGGTGFAGGALASQKGIVLLTGQFRQLSDYDRSQGTVWVEAGSTARTIDQALHNEEWGFPCSMETAGVAGLAGCLSTNACPYDKGIEGRIAQKILEVEVIDGTGKLKKAPASLFCGSEGILGLITRLHLQLTPRKDWKVAIFGISESDKKTVEHLRQTPALKSFFWRPEHKIPFQITLEEQSWRVEAAISYLKKHLRLIPESKSHHPFSLKNTPKGGSFFPLCSFLPMSRLIKAREMLNSLCLNFGLFCHSSAQLLDGRLFTLLYTEENQRTFNQKIESFLIEWANVLEKLEGSMISSHGIGKIFPPFITPFVQEGGLHYMQKIKSQWDPYGIFSKNNVLPTPGKCLEKMRLA